MKLIDISNWGHLDRERCLLARFKQLAALNGTHVLLTFSPDTVMRDWRWRKRGYYMSFDSG